jgi:iron complex outermembrane receptor protein
MHTYVTSFGRIFSGQLGEEAEKDSRNIAIYSQLEKKFFGRLTLLGGVRYEYFKLDDLEDLKPVFRTGMNLSITEATFFRASFGQGYRFPSIGERFITTNVGGFGFYPNPQLNPETSWNAEAGFKQFFKINEFVGFLDFAAFRQEYNNFVEFNAGVWGTDPDFSKNLGFRFLNTGRARVQGIDASITGMGEITKNVTLTIIAGYTYAQPISLTPNEIYFNDPTVTNIPFTYNSTSSDTTNNVLKYRIEHIGKMDVEITRKSICTGISGRYYSFMRNIDNFFIQADVPSLFPTGITKYREENNNGTFVFDYRISYSMRKNVKLSLIINNLFNSEFSLRPMTIESPRTTMLQVNYKI